jgi:hypothetical protein
MSRMFKTVWLALAIAGSAGLIFWMSEHGDLQSAMVDGEEVAGEPD